MNANYWHTREGKVIKISDMTDSHLNNTIEMLKKKNSCGDLVSDNPYLETMLLEKASRKEKKYKTVDNLNVDNSIDRSDDTQIKKDVYIFSDCFDENTNYGDR